MLTILIALILLVAALDVIALLTKGFDSTISYLIFELCRSYPVLLLILGATLGYFLCGWENNL